MVPSRMPLARAVIASSLAAASLAVPAALGSGLTNCSLPARGAKYLPATCSHGLINYLRQYPVVRLATPGQRANARSLRRELEAAAAEENWRDLGAAGRAGYDQHRHGLQPGDSSLQYFHAEHAPEPRTHPILYIRRPKALMFMQAPGGRPVLVGAMWTTKPTERGPTPGGPITRWHSHLVCADAQGHARAFVGAGCPSGTRLSTGRVEMMHIWFTHDLRSSYALRAPEPELCTAKLLPADYCRRLTR